MLIEILVRQNIIVSVSLGPSHLAGQTILLYWIAFLVFKPVQLVIEIENVECLLISKGPILGEL